MGRECAAREAETFYLDPEGVRQHAGIARGEEMVRSLEFRRQEQGDTADVTRRVSASQNEIAQAQQIVEASSEQAAILSGNCAATCRTTWTGG
jgi:hypothetical protein